MSDSNAERRAATTEPVGKVGVRRRALRSIQTLSENDVLSSIFKEAEIGTGGANKPATAGSPLESNEIITNNISRPEHTGYNGGVPDRERLTPTHACRRLFDAMTSSRELIVSASEMPKANLPEHDRLILAEAVGKLVEEAEHNRSVFEAKIAILKGGRLPVPKNWEEAKAQVPELKTWDEAKKESPSLTIIDYLADSQIGLGKWTLQEPGLPRYLLKVLYVPLDKDKPLKGSPYKALANWLSGTDADGKLNQIPVGMYIPIKPKETERLAALAKDTGIEPSARVDWAMRARVARQSNPQKSKV